MEELKGPIILGAFALFFVWIAVAFIRKSRARRRELYSEEVPRLPPETVAAPLVGESEAEAIPAELPAPEDERAEVVEPEPELEPEPESEPDEAIEVDEALERGLARTKESFFGKINRLFTGGKKLDPAALNDLEDLLLQSDIGVSLTMAWVEEMRALAKDGKLADAGAVRAALKGKILDVLLGVKSHGDPMAAVADPSPRVILFVGVNGVGKTTSIGKIASKLRADGQDVLLAAGDTFRAAAVEQLAIWAERTDSQIARGKEGADPASVVFNAVKQGTEASTDVVLADTAGRLHTKTALMDEIKKVQRASGKARDGAPDDVWLVVDATTGQNALQQARQFHEALGLSGVILTKLDGTAKGGVVVAIVDAVKVPVLFVGVGEKAEDLRPFEPRAFVEALFAG